MIMYRVCRPIYNGAEFFTYYGEEYANSLGIDVKNKAGDPGKENWKPLPSQGGTETVRRDHGLADKSRPFACKTCGKYFTQPGSLNRHINTVHLKQKAHACQLCDKRYICSR